MLFAGFLVAWSVLTFEGYGVRDTYSGDPLHTLLCRFTKHQGFPQYFSYWAVGPTVWVLRTSLCLISPSFPPLSELLPDPRPPYVRMLCRSAVLGCKVACGR